MQATIDTTNKRREKQMAYNQLHHIVPKTIKKDIAGSMFNNEGKTHEMPKNIPSKTEKPVQKTEDYLLSPKELDNLIASKKKAMESAVKELDFMLAAQLRDEIEHLKTIKKSQP